MIHDRNPLYVLLSDGSIQNGYDVKILNMTPQPRELLFTIEGLPGATVEVWEGHGHWLHLVDPDRFVARIRDFAAAT